MSAFLPDDLMRQMKQFEAMSKETMRALPAEMAGAANLLAYPMAGAAAMSALTVGMASQAFGAWMDAVSSVSEASHRMFAPDGEANGGGAPDTEAGEMDAVVARQPRSTERPVRPDDLKAVAGIGPKLETVLNGLGIWTFAQIAAWNPADVAWVENHLSLQGRTLRDDWIGQAARLAAVKTKN